MKVAIVNDSRAAAEVLRRIVTELPGFELLWTAYSGEEALQLTAGARPDIILMDLIMPGIDGAETTRQIMQNTPCVILVVTATTVGNRDLVFEAMGYGALDAVNTPTLGRDGDMSGAEPLLQKLRMVARLVAPTLNRTRITPATSPAAKSSSQPERETEMSAEDRPVLPILPIVAIGASTGGPQALAQVLAALPQGFPAAVLIAQHVDEHFAPGLASWLQHHSSLPVGIAKQGQPLEPGCVWIAGTNDHLVYDSEGYVKYTQHPRDTAYRPSVDALFSSLAQPHRGRRNDRIGVLLTGMGRDGAEGLLRMRRSGALTIAQNAATSVVYGMPRAAAELKAAMEILPLNEIGLRIRNAILLRAPAVEPVPAGARSLKS